MKKLMSAILVLAMMLTVLCAACADEIPQTESGKRFEGDWAIPGAKASIDYEEEGYRVYLEWYDREQLTGSVWQYSCFYNEEKDVLESFTSSRYNYTLDPETFNTIPGDDVYNDFDLEGQVTVFAINEEGKLIWTDARENEGADLEFQPIGRFDGMWQNDAEEVYAEINWEGMSDEETFFYTVFIRRGTDEKAVEFNMQGLYNWDTGKLEAAGTATSFVSNGQGGYEPVEDPETYEAFFSMQDNGKLLFEAANGIELDYIDPMMENS